MFYKIGGPHGLPHDPFKSCVVPRPIGWISTIGADDAVNLAPYSFFNAVSTEPPMVLFSSNLGIVLWLALMVYIALPYALDYKRRKAETSGGS